MAESEDSRGASESKDDGPDLARLELLRRRAEIVRKYADELALVDRELAATFSSPKDGLRRRVNGYVERGPEADAAHYAAMAYRPSAEGMLAARLYDGEARVPWSSPEHDTPEGRARGYWVEDGDFDRAEEVLTIIVDAFSGGDRAVLGRLVAARDLLADVPRTQGERHTRYLESIERYVQQARALEGALKRIDRLAEVASRRVVLGLAFARFTRMTPTLTPEERQARIDAYASRRRARFDAEESSIRAATCSCRLDREWPVHEPWCGEDSVQRIMHWFSLMRDALAKYDDPAFANLSVDRLREALRSVETDRGRRERGGQGTYGPLRIAAELAIEVGAFSLDPPLGDFDGAVNRTMSCWKAERSKIKSRQNEKG